jgi:hypothetical protein
MRLLPADVGQPVRRLAATPLLSLGAMVTLALGVAAAVGMADILDRLFLRPPTLSLSPTVWPESIWAKPAAHIWSSPATGRTKY